MIKIAPSILTWDFTNLERTLRSVERAKADMLHMDVMDGHFVPNISFGPAVVRAIRKKTSLVLDVHLMIEHPEEYIDVFAEAGADIITIHGEIAYNHYRLFERIRKGGLKTGLSLNPETPLDEALKYLGALDMVLLMTVNPGFGGQKFISSVLPKIRRLREIIVEKKMNIDIEVDGGINRSTAPLVVKAGANILVSGDYLYRARDMSEAITSLRKSG